MAGFADEYRRLIDLVESLQEAKKAPRDTAPFPVSKSAGFDESLKRIESTFGDIREKLAKFISLKAADPLAKYGKHDTTFAPGTPLAGFLHCHLRDDAVLIYTLKNRTLNLLMLCTHADIEGKNVPKMKKKLSELV